MVSGVCVLVFGTVVLEGREINDQLPFLEESSGDRKNSHGHS